MPAVPFNKQNDITDVAVHGDTAHIDIWYPRSSEVKFIEVGLMDTRSSDGVRVSYDFERDGWVIEQSAPTMEDRGTHREMVDHWQEVYFARSRALEPPEFAKFMGE
jgi:hypothetical protein